jgi:hypothetical protein
MLKMLFWNINGKPLVDALRWLCHVYEPHILILAECRIPDAELLLSINSELRRSYIIPPNDRAKRVKFLHRLAIDSWRILEDRERFAIRTVQAFGCPEIIIAAVHHQSKLHCDDYAQAVLMQRMVRVLEGREEQCGHQRSLVVGDLNMNPFEPGLCSSESLHAVMCKRIASRLDRTVRGEKRGYFYNPMWSLLGDESPGPPGTHFYRGDIVSYFWNTFDQVLFRPELAAGFQAGDVEVVAEVNGEPLITDTGLANGFSDHLPLVFNVRS